MESFKQSRPRQFCSDGVTIGRESARHWDMRCAFCKSLPFSLRSIRKNNAKTILAFVGWHYSGSGRGDAILKLAPVSRPVSRHASPLLFLRLLSIPVSGTMVVTEEKPITEVEVRGSVLLGVALCELLHKGTGRDAMQPSCRTMRTRSSLRPATMS